MCVCLSVCVCLCLGVEGDLYEDGMTLKNGFFRTRHFNGLGSEADSLELFSEDREREEEGEEFEGEGVGNHTQDIAKKHRDKLEKEEFFKTTKVNQHWHLFQLGSGSGGSSSSSSLT